MDPVLCLVGRRDRVTTYSGYMVVFHPQIVVSDPQVIHNLSPRHPQFSFGRVAKEV